MGRSQAVRARKLCALATDEEGDGTLNVDKENGSDNQRRLAGPATGIYALKCCIDVHIHHHAFAYAYGPTHVFCSGYHDQDRGLVLVWLSVVFRRGRVFVRVPVGWRGRGITIMIRIARRTERVRGRRKGAAGVVSQSSEEVSFQVHMCVWRGKRSRMSMMLGWEIYEWVVLTFTSGFIWH